MRRYNNHSLIPWFHLFAVSLLSCFFFAQSNQAANPCSSANFAVSTITVNSLRSVVTDDFNHDGKPDLATVDNRTNGTVAVLLGNGSGGFAGPTNFTGGRNALFLAAGDLNGDTHPDLVTANQASTQGALQVLFGNGSGGFGSAVPILQGTQSTTTAVAIADVNSDTKPDLIFTNSLFNAVTVLLNNGTGTFTFFKSFSVVGLGPNFLLIRDFNNDGKPDVATSNFLIDGSHNFGSVAILLGDGAGNFSAAGNFGVGSSPNAIAAGDFNGDTKLDLAVTNNGSNNISILIGDGSGQFGAATTFAALGLNPASLVASDFNADGKTDLAVMNPFPGGVVIFSGDGSGAFAPVSQFKIGGPLNGSSGASLAFGDFNNDGRIDLAVANELQRLVAVLLNSCGSAVTSEVQFNTSTFAGGENSVNSPTSFTVMRNGDITGVTSFDYTTSNGTATAPEDYTFVSSTASFAPTETYKVVTVPLVDDNITETSESFNLILSNVTGSATLGSPSAALSFILDDDPAPEISVNDPTVQEFDTGTSNLSFAVTLSHPSAFNITVNYATADGSAAAGSDYQSAAGMLTFSPGEVSKNIPVGVSGDLTEEITETFFLNLTGPVNATLADAQGVGTITDDDSSCSAPSFNTAPDVTVAGGSGPIALVKADLNNDGKVDLISAHAFTNQISVMFGNGAGGFGSPTNFTASNGARAIALADLNLDGKPDVITGGSPSGLSQELAVLLGNGAGGFAAPIITLPVAGSTDLSAGDLNADGKPDVVVVSVSQAKVFVLLGNGAGAFAAPVGYTVGTSPLSVELADFNNDTKLDMAVANQNSNNISILLGNGDGTFAAAVNIAAGQNPQKVAAGDFNGDGKQDLAAANLSSKNISIFLGNGSGGFQAANSVNLAHGTYSVTLADFNGDGKLDLAAPNYDDQFANGVMSVSFGNGAGGFSVPTDYAVAFGPLNIVAGDFNGDGKVEPAVANLRSDKLSIFLNACTPVQPTTTVRFSTAAFGSNEGNGNVVITVTRNGNTHIGSSVDYATSDTAGANNCNVFNGIASSRCDYITTIGTLRFAPNETTRSFSVLLVNDSYAEGNESFTVALSNAVDSTMGSPSTATVTMSDDDGLPGPNPIDQASAFVRQHYLDFLNREPDAGGLSFWSNQITECEQPGATCSAQVRRINVSAAFFLSIEFQETGYLVERIYKSAYGDATGTSNFGPTHTLPVPIVRFLEFLPDTQQIGNGVVVGQPGADQLLEANKVAFTQNFVMRTRFTTAYGTSLTPAQFVDALFTNAGVTPSSSDRTAAINEFGGAGNTSDTTARARALRRVAENSILNQQEKNRAFVLMQYFGYLRRNPNDPQDSDYTGYDFWLTKLNEFNGNFVSAEMVKAFIVSGEYRHRFGP